MILFVLGGICGAVVMLVLIAFVSAFELKRDRRDVVASHKAPKY